MPTPLLSPTFNFLAGLKGAPSLEGKLLSSGGSDDENPLETFEPLKVEKRDAEERGDEEELYSGEDLRFRPFGIGGAAIEERILVISSSSFSADIAGRYALISCCEGGGTFLTGFEVFCVDFFFWPGYPS